MKNVKVMTQMSTWVLFPFIFMFHQVIVAASSDHVACDLCTDIELSVPVSFSTKEYFLVTMMKISKSECERGSVSLRDDFEDGLFFFLRIATPRNVLLLSG